MSQETHSRTGSKQLYGSTYSSGYRMAHTEYGTHTLTLLPIPVGHGSRQLCTAICREKSRVVTVKQSTELVLLYAVAHNLLAAKEIDIVSRQLKTSVSDLIINTPSTNQSTMARPYHRPEATLGANANGDL